MLATDRTDLWKALLILQRQHTDAPGAYDQDEITTRFVHDTRFGAGRGVAFPTLVMGGRGFSTLRSYDVRGNVLSVDRAKAVASPASPPSGAARDFVGSATRGAANF